MTNIVNDIGYQNMNAPIPVLLKENTGQKIKTITYKQYWDSKLLSW